MYKKILALAIFSGSVLLPMTTFAAGPALVNLGSAGSFVILAKSGISTTGSTAVTGNIGVSPIAASALTGFGLVLDPSNSFSKSSLVNGNVYAADYSAPTPATMSTAVSDMQTAYTDAAGRSSTVTELGAGNIGGLTLSPGVYKWSTGVTIPISVTLSGSSNDVWIFQVAQNLTVSSGANVTLSGGAQASNVFWVVAGQTTIGTSAVFNGNILDQTAIVLNTGATLNGRALAQTAVTLDANTVGLTASASAPTPTPTPSPTPVVTPTPAPVTPQPVITPTNQTTTVSPTSSGTTFAALTPPNSVPTLFPNTGLAPHETSALESILMVSIAGMFLAGVLLVGPVRRFLLN